MGLLDNIDEPTMAMAMGLLGSGGYSRMPVSTGQGMAAGFGAFQEAKRAQQEMAMRRDMFDLNKQQHQMQLDQMQRAQADRDTAKANLQAYVSSMPDGPQKQLIIQAVQMGIPMTEVWKKLNPEAKLETVFTQDGREQKAWTAPGQDIVPVGGAKAMPLHFANTGGAIQGLDPMTGLPVGQGIAMQTSPDARLSAGTSRANALMADARARESQAFTQSQANKPVFNEAAGGFITAPRGMLPGEVRKVEGLSPKLTEDQAKATGWLVQAENAFNNMSAATKDQPSAARPGFPDVVAGIPSMGMGEALGNSMRGETRQKFVQGASSLSEALLRAATGAGVNAEEARQKVRELTPQIGDGELVIKQKMESIPLYIESLKVRSGGGANKVPGIFTAAENARAATPSANVVDFSKLRK